MAIVCEAKSEGWKETSSSYEYKQPRAHHPQGSPIASIEDTAIPLHWITEEDSIGSTSKH